jgi:NitT/TauT family transport system ATP-binding protein
MAEKIAINNLSKYFPLGKGKPDKRVLEDVSFNVEESSFTTIVGPSGCGKSTLLNIMAGTEPQTEGTITIAHEGRGEARVGYVFQAPRLLPWMTVMDNMLFVKPADADAKAFKAQAEHYLEVVGLGTEHKTYPLALSGGMQQRAGIARALAVDPDVLLMDEPFSHLDEITAENLRLELWRIWSETKKTILFVTHDLNEGILLADRIIVFGRNGKMLDDWTVELPRPREFTNPVVTKYMADFTTHFFDLQAKADREMATEAAA